MSKHHRHEENDQNQKNLILLWFGVGMVILVVIVTFFSLMVPPPIKPDAGVAVPQKREQVAPTPVAPAVSPVQPAKVAPIRPAPVVRPKPVKRPMARRKPHKRHKRHYRKHPRRARRVARKRPIPRRPVKRATSPEESMEALRSSGKAVNGAAVAKGENQGKSAGAAGGKTGGASQAELAKSPLPNQGGKEPAPRAKVKLAAAKPATPVAFTLFFRNKIERTDIFRLLKVECYLDKTLLLQSTVEKMPSLRKEEVKILERKVLPGRYKFTLKIEARGHGLGLFAYRKNFRYHASSDLELEVKAGNAFRVVSELRDVGGQNEKKRIQVFFLTRER
ncbi:MAG: hypothetical protein H6727_12085 [Myxococcales bacterium]|nr:hypothetical protein [Myxococcales bacterium]